MSELRAWAELRPALIGELGVPFDMKKTKFFGLAKGAEEKGDYKQSTKVSGRILLVILTPGYGRATSGMR